MKPKRGSRCWPVPVPRITSSPASSGLVDAPAPPQLHGLRPLRQAELQARSVRVLEPAPGLARTGSGTRIGDQCIRGPLVGLALCLLALAAPACKGDGEQRPPRQEHRTTAHQPEPSETQARRTKLESEAPAADMLAIEHARAPATGQARAAAVYLRVINGSNTPDRLVAAHAPLAASTEMHESRLEQGVVRMVAHPNGFEVPAGGSLELAPGGKHIMLLGLRKPLAAGASLELDLRFARAGERKLEVSITPRTAAHSHSKHEGHSKH
ncbi:MAG: copper chaperone PCu(A)C [Proteobacteria bacterium]|nr:copper chaperone PCu(A)C [Pseudomonadota bacterium]